jgi:hypothetical protein
MGSPKSFGGMTKGGIGGRKSSTATGALSFTNIVADALFPLPSEIV